MRVVKANTMDELQTAIRKAKSGDVICVPPNFTIMGALILSNHNGNDNITVVSALGK